MALGLIAATGVAGCASDGAACGTGTSEVDGVCVPDSQLTCGEGTKEVEGACVPDDTAGLTCGEGTKQDGNQCVVDAEEPLLEFELTEEDSGYAELIPDLMSIGAADEDNHLDQAKIAEWVTAGVTDDQILFLFDHGDELTEIEFKEADGIGVLTIADSGTPVSLPSRFTRTPTADRFTGPNGVACLSCHNAPIGNSGGANVVNVMQDPDPAAAGLFNPRQTISINGGGAIQILAEDMTEELQELLQDAKTNLGTTVDLTVKDGAVNFGSIVCNDNGGTTECNYENVKGISPDLIVRPMGWKGNFPTLRGFTSDAAWGEMGMQSDEILWKITSPGSGDTPREDQDGDGVDKELTVGDITALTVYLAMQEIPTSVVALADANLATASAADLEKIEAGRQLFVNSIADDGLDCARCHVAKFQISTTIFSEPSPRANQAFEDLDLADRDVGYTSANPLEVDLSADPTDIPRLVKENDGTAIIEPYTDLKRHFMGNHLADDARTYIPKDASQFAVEALPEDADDASKANVTTEIGRGEFLTPELWGVGNTGPWLHDGRALTLRQAILLHGEDNPGAEPSAAQAERDAFNALSKEQQDQVLAFLLNLVLVDMSDEEE